MPLSVGEAPSYPLAQYLEQSNTPHSQLIYGCMGLGGGWNNNSVSGADVKQAQAVIETCLAHNIRTFDHADIYTFGKAEIAFGRVLAEQPHLRAQMSIQSKCGIRFADALGGKRYDLSPEWVTQSVDSILTRLQIEHIDVLLLHRPDPLLDVAALAQALMQLHQQGKIGHIGVSNMHVAQIAQLQAALTIPLVANQIELSLGHTGLINSAIEPEQPHAGMAEYAQTHGLQIQAWGALFQGQFTRAIDANTSTNTQHTINLINSLANKYGVSQEAIMLSFLTRLPMQIQPIIGSTNLARIADCAQVYQVRLSRCDWYALLESSRAQEIP